MVWSKKEPAGENDQQDRNENQHTKDTDTFTTKLGEAQGQNRRLVQA